MTSRPAERSADWAGDLPHGLSIVVHSGTLGDLVLTFPLLRALAAGGPVWAVSGWSAARLAARRVAGVEAVDGDQPRWARLFGPHPPDDPELDRRLAAAERVVSFVAGPSDAWAANVAARALRARLAFVPPRPPRDWPSHVTDWFDARLTDAGLPAGTAHGVAPAPAAAPTVPPVAAPLDRPIVLHPGSGAADKCWPADRYWALAEALRSAGGAVQVVLGEAERTRWPEREVRRWRSAFDVRLPDSLAALEALLAGAATYVGNDSGPTQLAAEIGVPTVALFGPTSPQRWRPIGAAVTVLAPPSPAAMTWLSLENVVAAVHAAVPASDLTAVPEAGPAAVAGPTVDRAGDPADQRRPQ